MRTTITVDDHLLREAQEISGITKVSAMITKSLELMIQQYSARRLSALGGSDVDAFAGPRNR